MDIPADVRLKHGSITRMVARVGEGSNNDVSTVSGPATVQVPRLQVRSHELQGAGAVAATCLATFCAHMKHLPAVTLSVSEGSARVLKHEGIS